MIQFLFPKKCWGIEEKISCQCFRVKLWNETINAINLGCSFCN